MVVYLVQNVCDGEVVGVFSSREKAINAMLKVYDELVERFPEWKEDYETDVAIIKEDCELTDIFYTEDIQIDDILT